MKKIILTFFVLLKLTITWAQDNVSIDAYLLVENSNFSRIQSTYFNTDLEICNVFLDSAQREFITFGILPDRKERRIKWQKIDLASLNSKIIDVSILQKWLHDSRENYSKGPNESLGWLKSSNLKPILKKGNAYFIPSDAIMEYFIDVSSIGDKMMALSTIFPNSQKCYQININAKILPIITFENDYLYHTGGYSFNYDGPQKSANDVANFPFDLLIREDNIEFKGKTAFRFWNLSAYFPHSYGLEKGAQRFTYIPKIGIIAVCYDLYWFNKIWNAEIGHDETLRRLEFNYLHNIQSTPLRIELNGKLIYEKD